MLYYEFNHLNSSSKVWVVMLTAERAEWKVHDPGWFMLERVNELGLREWNAYRIDWGH